MLQPQRPHYAPFNAASVSIANRAVGLADTSHDGGDDVVGTGGTQCMASKSRATFRAPLGDGSS